MSLRIYFGSSDWASYLEDDGTKTLTMGGAGQARVGMPAQELTRRGHEVLSGTLAYHKDLGRLGVRTADEELHFESDVLIMQRHMETELVEIVQLAAEVQVIVNDVDDWYDGLDPTNQAYHTSHPKCFPAANRDSYRKIVAGSTMTTCSTPFLADRYLGRHGSLVVPNAIDLSLWDPERTYTPSPTVGWVGAVQWRSGDLEILRGVLAPFLEKHGLKFHHGGAAMPNPWRCAQCGGHAPGLSARDLLRLPPTVEFTAQDMVPVDRYPSLFTPIDIGLVPLAHKPFNDAKSAIKGYEYAAAGVPFVASDTPEYRKLANLGIGRVARKPRDWTRHLTELLDPEVRAMEAKRNRERLEPFDIRVMGGNWERAYSRAMRIGRHA